MGVMREMSVDDDTPDDQPRPHSGSMADDPLFTPAEGEDAEAKAEEAAPMEVDG
jgi:hypothetical protein